MKDEFVPYLVHIARLGGASRLVALSTRALGQAVNRSQQTASRVLGQMQKNGLIVRRKRGRTQELRLTEKGVRELRTLYMTLSDIFKSHTIEGKVFTGLGEGAYYVSQDGYRRQFKEKIGFDPYPGTLNITVIRSEDMRQLAQLYGVEIEGFVAGSRTFGGGKAIPANIAGRVFGAVFIPDRTHYPPDVVEVVAPVNLRQALMLKDGDTLTVTVPYFPA